MKAKYTGAELIARERQRQIEVEGFDDRHDDVYRDRELVYAGILYAAAPQSIYIKEEKNGEILFREPWIGWWNPAWDKRAKHPELKRLVIAGALIAAEIDRLLRQMDGFVEIDGVEP